jgi:hypothetical protein
MDVIAPYVDNLIAVGIGFVFGVISAKLGLW